nr:NADH dehydrogenase subunit 5 [Bankia setacea]UPX89099.1 NADH dehydrogenase subunit 5 [Bankia setacea]UPX89111.1 NADH dehydrogenase subunit 5 [Bankia setacea]UPX89123.1 NADH dehydrogenase subunit 5 [Bankia setacea]
MFTFFFLIKWLFLDMVKAGYSLAFEWDLSATLPVTCSLLFYVDWASVMFSMSVLFISGSVFIYCCFYMHGDPHPDRFCWLVGLFVFFMNIFIFMPSMMGMLIGWDGLGIVSFALVSYYKNHESLSAGMVTLLTGRIGDACLILMVASVLHNMSWNWYDMQQLPALSVMALIVVGSMTKSAQAPFSAWLPAAMAAPTPVSALVHSSTLVTAGVYVIYRYFDCVQGSWAVYLVFFAMMTMLVSGFVALGELDVKKVVAFSTMSQLGVMMLSLSAVATKEIGMYHLLVHAYYKSLMFLCVGCGIYKGGGNQDSRLSQTMWLKMPIVSGWLFVACFSLGAVPFTSGYWSKHAVVEGCIHGEVSILGAIVVCMSVLVTSFYTFRLMYLLFFSGQQNPFAKVEVPYSGEGFSSRLFVFIPLHLLGIASMKVGPYLHSSFSFVGAPVHSPVWFSAVSLVMTAGGGLLALVGNPWVTGGLRWSFLNKKSSKSLYKYSNVPDAHWFMKSHWFYPHLSGNTMSVRGLKFISDLSLVVEKGWMTVFVMRNMLRNSAEISKKWQRLGYTVAQFMVVLILFIMMKFICTRG